MTCHSVCRRLQETRKKKKNDKQNIVRIASLFILSFAGIQHGQIGGMYILCDNVSAQLFSFCFVCTVLLVSNYRIE